MFFLILRYSYLIYITAGPKTIKFYLSYLVELHCLGAFLLVATVGFWLSRVTVASLTGPREVSDKT